VPGQQIGRVYRLGILEAVPATRNHANLDSLRKGLRELGYIEGQNLLIEYRSTDGRAERFQELAAELVASKVDLILTRGTPAALPGGKSFQLFMGLAQRSNQVDSCELGCRGRSCHHNLAVHCSGSLYRT
jgi:hypothetical protein